MRTKRPCGRKTRTWLNGSQEEVLQEEEKRHKLGGPAMRRSQILEDVMGSWDRFWVVWDEVDHWVVDQAQFRQSYARSMISSSVTAAGSISFFLELLEYSLSQTRANCETFSSESLYRSSQIADISETILVADWGLELTFSANSQVLWWLLKKFHQPQTF